jgi:hypothetical protein
VNVRLYRPEDEQAVREIFAKQQIDADLPLPWADPCVAVALVGEEDGKVKLAIIGRLMVEAHLVIAPDEPQAAAKIRKVMTASEGAMMAISAAMREKKCAGVDDIQAFVPEKMTRMHDLIQVLGFVRSDTRWIPYWKRIGG